MLFNKFQFQNRMIYMVDLGTHMYIVDKMEDFHAGY